MSGSDPIGKSPTAYSDASSRESALMARARRGVAATAGVGVAASIVQIAFLPWVISYVGTAAYATWIPQYALILFVNYIDLNLDTAVVSRGAAYISRGDIPRAWSLFRFSRSMYVAIGVLASVLVLLIDPLLGSSSASPSLLFAGVLFGTLLPNALRPSQLILLANNRFDLERLGEGCGVVARVLATSGAILLHAPVTVVICTEVTQLWFPAVVALLIRRRAFPRPRVARIPLGPERRDVLRFMLRAGVGSALAAGSLQLTPVLAASALPPEQLVAFGVAFRIYVAARRTITWIVDPHLAAVSAAIARSRAAGSKLYASVATDAVALVGFLVVPAVVYMSPLCRLLFPSVLSSAGVAAAILLATLLANALSAPVPLMSAALNIPQRLIPASSVYFAATIVVIPVVSRVTHSATSVAAAVGGLAVFGQLLLIIAIDGEVGVHWKELGARIGRASRFVVVAGCVALVARLVLGDRVLPLLAGLAIYAVIASVPYARAAAQRTTLLRGS
jgi:hypothetical protein